MTKQKTFIIIGGLGLLAFAMLRPQSANAAEVAEPDPFALNLGAGSGGSGGGGGGAFTQLLAQSLASSDDLRDNNSLASVPTPAPIKTRQPVKLAEPAPTPSPTPMTTPEGTGVAPRDLIRRLAPSLMF